MRLQIESKGVKLTDKLQSLIDHKLGQDIEKYLKDFEEDLKVADIRIREDSRWGYTVSFSMILPKKEHIFGETKDKILETAINSLKDIIQKNIRNYKDKLQNYQANEISEHLDK